jgi:inorganic triphosphatase YgiF
MAQEIELKLLLPGLTGPQALQALRRTPVLARRPLQQLQLWNRYFDTPDGALRQQRAALRLRRVQVLAQVPGSGGQAARPHWLQTLKTAGSGGAMSQRGEWEQPLRSGRPSAQALPAEVWQTLDPAGDVWPALALCFETRCVRTLWRVRPRAGVLIGVALDVGQVRATGRSVPLVELELELLQGPPEAVFELAQALGAHVALLPSPVSKAERGYALASGQAAAAAKARPPALHKAATPAQVAPLLLDEVLNQLLRNLEGLRHSDAPEWVHQARVAWRRWRSLVRLLGPWLPTPAPPPGL